MPKRVLIINSVIAFGSTGNIVLKDFTPYIFTKEEITLILQNKFVNTPLVYPAVFADDHIVIFKVQ
jgi:hypothetical protein